MRRGNFLSGFPLAPDDEMMSDHSDRELLRAFASRGEEAAFAEVVRRWGGLVYGAALRRTGDRGLAEEVSQKVLLTLARRAGELASHPALAAWLHKATSFESARALEKESNRRRYMNRYAEEVASRSDGGADEAAWREALPELDAALADLAETDRQILLLRYWERRPFRAIAEAAGTSVAACEKRAERALVKLSSLLRRRGVALSAAALGAGLSTALSEAAVPPALVGPLAAAAAQAARATTGAASVVPGLTIMKAKLVPAGVLLLVTTLSGAGGFLAARSIPREAAVTARVPSAVGEPGAAPPSPPVLGAGPRRASLRALLAAVQQDLATASMDPVAAARAAARVATIESEDIEAALAMADDLAGVTGDSGPLVSLVLQRWAEIDPQAACETAQRRPGGRFLGLPALADPLKVWAAKDPQAAFEWYRTKAAADEVKAGEGQRWKPISSLRWIMGAWALQDAQAAANAFRKLESPEQIAGALTGFGELAGAAPGRTAILDAWLAMGPDGTRTASDLRSLLQHWSQHRPAELAAWLDRSGMEGSARTSVAGPILTSWLREDSGAAIDWWFRASGEKEAGGRELEPLVSAWAEADVFAAADWLAAQPLDETAAGSMATLAARIARSDPERGWLWALRIPLAAVRTDALRQVVSTWAASERKDAAAAIEAAPLDEAVRAELRKALPAQ